MKIYTYYENVNFELQNALLELWTISWKRHGFDPIILSREDAKKSPLYNEYYDFVQSVHELSVGKQLPEGGYWLAAQLEIVAFHTISDPSYASDYDMINNGFKLGETIEGLVHWRNRDCSCFASGDCKGWEKYIQFLFNSKQIIVDHCKQTNYETNRVDFGDQDFLVAVRELGLKNNIYKMYRNLEIAGAEYDPDGKNLCKIIHLSHNNMIHIKKTYPEYAQCPQDELRILFANKIINHKH